jgi:WXXGXW repeat (2 copies)
LQWSNVDFTWNRRYWQRYFSRRSVNGRNEVTMRKNKLRLNPVRAAIAGLVLTALPMASFAFVSVGISVNFAPPALPVYVQPPCPGVGYIWTPGYWAWNDGDYYWVPGTWVLAPEPGFLWTPGYWGWGGGVYVWHAGYWGPHVGFYGGINYGFGYTGVGFSGGYWRGHDFYYNRAYNNLGGVHVTNVYNKTVINNVTVNHVSFNGGEGGVHAQPTARELSAEHEHHVAFTPAQHEHEHMAFANHDLRASVNGGKPSIAATARPASFTGHGVVGARAAGAPYHAAEHGGAVGGAGPAHGAVGGAGPAHAAAIRNDRPPGATSNAGVHGGASAGRGAEFHAGAASHEQQRFAAARNDRPPTGAGSALHNEATRSQTPHVNQMSSTRNFEHNGGGQPAPHPQAMAHPQAMPHMQSAPRPQPAPQHMQPAPQHMQPAPQHMQMQRPGGGEPRGGQGPRPQPQARGEQQHEHGRR